MGDDRAMFIGEVVERTGLTERTLRFYEEHGLIAPRRTAGGRRVYGGADLARLHHITLLKRAGFSLSEIKRLVEAASFDAAEVVDTQIAALEQERSLIDRALASLRSAKAVSAAGESLDVASLCDLILLGERQMKTEAWQKYFDKHYSPEEQERWKSAKLRAAGGNWESYSAKWEVWARRLEQALPLDPGSETARQFLLEWKALVKPFTDALTEDMKEEAESFAARIKYDTTDDDLPVDAIDRRIMEFIEAARRAHGDV